MKRDMELIRQILFRIEETPGDRMVSDIEIEDYDPETVNYHVRLMYEAGLLAGEFKQYSGGAHYLVRMTWQGHDFLDACRDNERWHRAKSVFGKIGGVTFDVAKQVLTMLLMDQAKTQLGLQ